MDEPDRLVVPARRERHHADAHRRRQHLRGPAAAVRGSARDGRGQARSRAALPAEGSLRAARRRLAGVDRRPSLQPRLPPSPHRDPRSRQRGAAASDGRPRVLPAPRPEQAAVGAVDGRGPGGGTLGAAVEGPSLHGRRRRRDRSDVGDVLRHDAGAGDARLGGCAGALRPRGPDAHDRAARELRRGSSTLCARRC